jgi:hypothetical protein
MATNACNTSGARFDVIKESLDWLDRYLGPVK